MTVPNPPERRGEVEVVTLGEALLVLTAPPGTPLGLADQFAASVAGAEINVATGLARLGHRVRFVSRVGDDFAGDLVRRSALAEGIDVSRLLVEPGAETGLLFRDVHPDRPVTVAYRRAGSAASRLSPSDVPAAAFADARCLYVSGITAMLSPSAREAACAAVVTAHELGLVVCVDPNLRRRLGPPEAWRAAVGPLVEAADVVVAGTDELEVVAGPDALDRLLTDRDRTVVVKAADKSATAHTRAGSVRRPALAVHVVDPVGAGDAFTAGFLSARLRGLDLARALDDAATVAALVVATATDCAGLPAAPLRDHARLALTSGAESTLR